MKLSMKNINSLVLISFAASMLWLIACNKNNNDTPSLANEASLSGSSAMTVTESDTTITVSYDFVVPAREAGEATINATVDSLSYGVNYTTDPAEATGVITVPFAAGDASIKFNVVVIDDNKNLPDGTVTFTLSEITGENATVTSGKAAFALTILDNEGESITPASTDATDLGEVVPGTQSDSMEVSFTSLNIVTEIKAEASTGFVVAATADGTYAATATLAADATSFFVRAAPDASAAIGEATGTVTLSAGAAKVDFPVMAIVSGSVGTLFWAENFDYPVNDTYPSYGDNGFSGAIVPVSARYRMAAKYNGTDASVAVISGLERTGVFDTWYTQHRMHDISMGDNPLTFTGYPNSGVGRTMLTALDGGNQNQRNDCNFEPKNSAIARRFVDNGSEITSGNVYMAMMIKVNAVYPEETPTLKNAIIMLTGDAAFVNVNAMKLNVRDDGNGGFNFGVSKSSDDGSVIYGSTSYELGKTYAVIMKVEINEDLAGGDPNDAVSVYVFKDGDAIPAFDDPNVTPEAMVDATNQDLTDAHDVTTGLEIVFAREVADAWSAGGIDNIKVQETEMSGIRVATSWTALLKDASEAMYDNQSDDDLQSLRYGNTNCGGLGNTDM